MSGIAFDVLGAGLEISIVSGLILASLTALVRLATKLRLASFKRELRSSKHVGGKSDKREPRVIGFFHPFCDAMGGGEKVLFQAIKALQDERLFENDTIMVYSGASMKPDELCDAVKDKFGTRIKLQ